MKVFISADVEGAIGVTSWDDIHADKSPYERFRKFLIRDVNAAIEGAIEAGATEGLVNEAHVTMRNILIEELNPAARMISGFHGKWLGMMEGIDGSFDAAFLVGYRAKAGTDAAILNHTFTKRPQPLEKRRSRGRDWAERRPRGALRHPSRPRGWGRQGR